MVTCNFFEVWDGHITNLYQIIFRLIWDMTHFWSLWKILEISRSAGSQPLWIWSIISISPSMPIWHTPDINIRTFPDAISAITFSAPRKNGLLIFFWSFRPDYNTHESFKIIGTAKNDYHLKIKESLNILRENPVINKTVKAFPLYLFWCRIAILKIKTCK